MTITVRGTDYEINDINWKQSRRLHHLHKQAYFQSSIKNNKIEDLKIDFDKFYEAVDFAIEVAFDDVEGSLRGLDHSHIDEIGQTIMSEYLNPLKKNGNSD